MLKMEWITDVFETSEDYIRIILNNRKELTRKIRKSVNDDSEYFVFRKKEYYLHELGAYRIIHHLY